LRPYQEYLSKLAKEFEEIEFTRIGREMNHFADVLATLAAMATNELRHKVQLVHIDIRNYPAHCCSIKGEICHNPFLGSFKLHSLFLKKKNQNSAVLNGIVLLRPYPCRGREEEDFKYFPAILPICLALLTCPKT
jgi:hypothetical protein